MAFIGGIIIFVREYQKKKKQHTEELETMNLLHKKELLETQVEIQTQTMKYIGKEIHDNVGQKLTLSSIYLQQIVFENNSPQLNKNINNVNNIINESLSQLRYLSKSLTCDTIEENSMINLIDLECQKINQLKKYNINYDSSLTVNVNSYQTKSILLRIVQEFIQNSLKHSNCKNININLSNTSTELELQLSDDGQGFDIKNLKSNGIGLNNIDKRIKILNGSSSIFSNKTGTFLTLKIPI
ncbi:ATP-binding protein [uncultured Winogradskyella sp.]|uniref:sensor histidine kinase n=1 Tax=uncultured Winogradskyella sp. TaxID=395353 RepID=UPI002625C367|nr:ATP-binding protein [uncultured Winogradskyella sp.]